MLSVDNLRDAADLQLRAQLPPRAEMTVVHFPSDAAQPLHDMMAYEVGRARGTWSHRLKASALCGSSTVLSTVVMGKFFEWAIKAGKEPRLEIFERQCSGINIGLSALLGIKAGLDLARASRHLNGTPVRADDLERGDCIFLGSVLGTMVSGLTTTIEIGCYLGGFNGGMTPYLTSAVTHLYMGSRTFRPMGASQDSPRPVLPS